MDHATLAKKRGTTMTAAIVQALENELAREREEIPLAERLLALADETRRMARGPGREVTREEIDDMWTR
jgi:antitoxin VapB